MIKFCWSTDQSLLEPGSVFVFDTLQAAIDDARNMLAEGAIFYVYQLSCELSGTYQLQVSRVANPV